MTETAGPPPDVDAIVRELQDRVAQRYAAGEYPPDLERELKAHFDDLVRTRRLPDRFADLMRRLDDAANFSPHRIQLVSSLPGGRRLHALIAAAVRRQVTGILAQDRLFAVSVRDVLTEVIQALPERSAPDTWWDVPDAYLEELYGPRPAAVADLGGLAAHLAEAPPVLVLETGRGELLAAVRGRQVEAETVEGDPLLELQARPDRSLGALGVRRVLERLGGPAADRLAGLAARKLRPGGRLAIECRSREARPDPALPRPVDPEYLAFLLRDAGFGEVAATRRGDADRLTAVL